MRCKKKEELDEVVDEHEHLVHSGMSFYTYHQLSAHLSYESETLGKP
jgi:hypothetical protein